MKNGFVFSDNEFELTGEGQLSMGEGLEMSQRFAYDYSKRPQTIVFRKRRTARTGSVSVTFGHAQVENVFDEIAKYEAIVGRVGEFYWNKQNLGKFLIKSAQMSFALDGVDIISGCQIGLEIQEGFERKARKHVNVQLL